MAFQQAQLQNFALAGAGAIAGATSLVLKSFETIDGVPLAMTDFGAVGYATLEPGNGTQEEQISFTGVTQNTNGTATLTGIKTVLFLSPYTKTSGLAKTHSGSSVFVISNTAGFYSELAVKENNESISGYWEVPDPITNQGIANKEYVLSVVNGGPVTTNALIEVGTAGETIAAGQPVYLKASDGRWYKAIGTTAATVNTIQLGIAQGAGTVGVSITGGVLRRGIDTHQSGGVAGSIGYVSNTSTIATSTGTVERAIGNFITATTFDFDPAFYYTLTADLKAAAAGNQGTPSSTNTFLTTQSTSAGATDQSQATQNALTIVGAANSTGNRNKIAQSFIPTATQIRGVILNKQADTGTFTGTVTVSIQADTAGSPSGVALATRTLVNIAWVGYSTGSFFAFFTTEAALSLATTYWIVIETSTSDSSNHPNLGINSAGGYTNGSVKFNNTTDGWVAVATVDITFSTLAGYTGKDLVGNSSGILAPSARTLLAKLGNITITSGTKQVVVHGLGKIPAFVRASWALGSSSAGAYSMGIYESAGGTYTENNFYYNEGSGGGNGPNTDRVAAANTTGSTNNAALTIAAIDENVVVFDVSTGTGLTFTYEIIA